MILYRKTVTISIFTFGNGLSTISIRFTGLLQPDIIRMCFLVRVATLNTIIQTFDDMECQTDIIRINK